MVYKEDNRTGPLVDVKKWLDNQELGAELNLRAEAVEVCVCVCVRVCMHVCVCA